MTTASIVRAGFERACSDFDAIVAPLGFMQVKKGLWSRRVGERFDHVHLHRGGSTYGASHSASVAIRVHFASGSPADPLPLNGPSSESLRDGRGYAYHLRFNARSGSTYDRCINDLRRVLDDHGLPWFDRQGA